MLVAGLYDGNVAVYNLQVPTTDLVIWSCEDLPCKGDSAVSLKISKSMTHEVVFYKYVCAEEHDQAKLHLFGNEWETQGVGVAGALSRE